MKALFRLQEDNTLYAAKIASVSYEVEERVLHFVCEGHSENEIFVAVADQPTADQMIRILFSSGTLDVSNYQAFLNEYPETADSMDDTEETSGIFGLFGKR